MVDICTLAVSICRMVCDLHCESRCRQGMRRELEVGLLSCCEASKKDVRGLGKTQVCLEPYFCFHIKGIL